MSNKKTNQKNKILAVSSFGGHWVQLLRIVQPLEQDYDISYICTNKKSSTMAPGKHVYNIMDFSRWNAWRMIPSFFNIFYVLIKERPNTVLSTGAAPGFLVLVVAKFLFLRKTIWIDSLANAYKLSFCGKLAAKMPIDYVYTQWEHLSNERVKYAGNTLGC